MCCIHTNMRSKFFLNLSHQANIFSATLVECSLDFSLYCSALLLMIPHLTPMTPTVEREGIRTPGVGPPGVRPLPLRAVRKKRKKKCPSWDYGEWMPSLAFLITRFYDHTSQHHTHFEHSLTIYIPQEILSFSPFGVSPRREQRWLLPRHWLLWGDSGHCSHGPQRKEGT